jgi:hypothetical protein
MDDGKFDAQVASLEPAHRANPFQMIPAVVFKDANPDLGNSDEEKSDDSQATDTQMAAGGGDPDVEQDPDAAGQVSRAANRVRRAQPVAAPQPPPRQPNFFERLFGARRSAPQPIPPPARRPPGRR